VGALFFRSFDRFQPGAVLLGRKMMYSLRCMILLGTEE
jgi:hypothetical protein